MTKEQAVNEAVRLVKIYARDHGITPAEALEIIIPEVGKLLDGD